MLAFYRKHFIWEKLNLSADNVGFLQKHILSYINPYYLIRWCELLHKPTLPADNEGFCRKSSLSNYCDNGLPYACGNHNNYWWIFSWIEKHVLKSRKYKKNLLETSEFVSWLWLLLPYTTPPCLLHVRCMLTAGSQYVHFMSITCLLYAHCTYTQYVHSMSITCSLYAHCTHPSHVMADS